MIGYMITWATYGSWLQGGEKGYSKDGVQHSKDPMLLRANLKRLQKPAVKLDARQKQIVRDEVYKVAERLGQRVYSVAVCSNHVHIVVSNILEEIDSVVGRYKGSTAFVLKKCGVDGKVWARGIDKRFCFDEESLQARIEYVARHGEE